MNLPLRDDRFSRRAFSASDVRRMQETGILGPNERFELIEGDIVPMQAKNFPHERIKLALVKFFIPALPDHCQLGVETSLFLSASTIIDPDLSVFPAGMNTEMVQGTELLLAIEVADSTLAYDKGLKAQLYARYGVRELWVIDARRMSTTVHRTSQADGWGEITQRAASETLAPMLIPGVSLRLADLLP